MPKKYAADSTLAEVLTTEKGRRIVTEFFSEVCLSCSAVKGETLGLSAHFHGVDINRLLDRLNSTAGKSGSKISR